MATTISPELVGVKGYHRAMFAMPRLTAFLRALREVLDGILRPNHAT